MEAEILDKVNSEIPNKNIVVTSNRILNILKNTFAIAECFRRDCTIDWVYFPDYILF